MSLYKEYKDIQDSAYQLIQNLLKMDLKANIKNINKAMPDEYWKLEAVKTKYEGISLKEMKVNQMPFEVSPLFITQVTNLVELIKFTEEKMSKENITRLRDLS